MAIAIVDSGCSTNKAAIIKITVSVRLFWNTGNICLLSDIYRPHQWLQVMAHQKNTHTVSSYISSKQFKTVQLNTCTSEMGKQFQIIMIRIVIYVDILYTAWTLYHSPDFHCKHSPGIFGHPQRGDSLYKCHYKVGGRGRSGFIQLTEGAVWPPNGRGPISCSMSLNDRLSFSSKASATCGQQNHKLVPNIEAFTISTHTMCLQRPQNNIANFTMLLWSSRILWKTRQSHDWP